MTGTGRAVALVAALAIGCGPVPAVLELPRPPWAESAVLGLIEGGNVELWALELDGPLQSFEPRARLTPDMTIDARVWFYDTPLAEVRLEPGPILAALPGTGRRLPSARERFVTSIAGAEVAPWRIDDEGSLELERFRTDGVDCGRWEVRSNKIAAASVDWSVRLGERALLGAGVWVYVYEGDRVTRLDVEGGAPLDSACVDRDGTLYVAGHEVFRAEIEGDRLALQPVATTTVGPLIDETFESMACAEFGLVMLARHGRVFRLTRGAPALEHVHTFVYGPDTTERSEIEALSDGRVVVAFAGSADLLFVTERSATAVNNGLGLGMLSVAEVDGLGLVMGSIGTMLVYANGQFRTLPGVPIAGGVQAVRAVPTGFVASGATGLGVEYVPDLGFCPAAQVREGDASELLDFGGGRFYTSGSYYDSRSYNSIEVLELVR